MVSWMLKELIMGLSLCCLRPKRQKKQQFRPICLLNCLFKWLTKCMTIRLEPVAGRIIHNAQTTFIKGRNIMTSVLTLHEVFHETKRRKNVGVVFKIDFEKAYDKIHWDFLIQCLGKGGFSETWCIWMRKVMEQGTVAVKLNNTVGPYFLSHKGVRHGDPLSPLLFNFAADVLTRMVRVVKQNSLVVGLADNLIPNEVAILQYADDIVLCLAESMEKVIIVKLMLYMFEKMSSLKINFDKSEVVIVGGDNALAIQYAELFNCQVGLFPMKYLGVPIAPRRLHVIDWAKMEDKYVKNWMYGKGALSLWQAEIL
jgi:hypothetical protein